MKHDEFDTLDDFIDEALKSERTRQVPFGFHREVTTNLRVTAQIQSERNKYRTAMLVGVTTYTLLFGSATLYMVLGIIASSILDTVPGFLAYYTDLLRTIEVWWVEIVVFSGLMTGIGAWTLLNLNRDPAQRARN